jgi:hypothetical protein
MKKIVRLTESDLVRIVKRVLNEDQTSNLKVRAIVEGDMAMEFKVTRFAEVDGGVTMYMDYYPRNGSVEKLYVVNSKDRYTMKKQAKLGIQGHHSMI